MKLKVQNLQGKVVSSIEASDKVFRVQTSTGLVHQMVVGYQANARQGTSDTKRRGEVSGGGRKPYSQKGTGRSRQGSIRSPLLRHGGVAFGPHPRSYRQDMPKRMRRQALAVSLSEKVRSNDLMVVENLDLGSSKTKEMATVLTALKADKSVLLVADGPSPEMVRAAKNLQKVDTLPAYQLNAYDVLRHRKLVFTVGAVRKTEELWGGQLGRRTSFSGESEIVGGES